MLLLVNLSTVRCCEFKIFNILILLDQFFQIYLASIQKVIFLILWAKKLWRRLCCSRIKSLNWIKSRSIIVGIAFLAKILGGILIGRNLLLLRDDLLLGQEILVFLVMIYLLTWYAPSFLIHILENNYFIPF